MKTSTKITECVHYNGNATFIENGEVKTILNEEIEQNNGDMTIEQLKEVLTNEMTMIYNNELHNKKASIK